MILFLLLLFPLFQIGPAFGALNRAVRIHTQPISF